MGFTQDQASTMEYWVHYFNYYKLKNSKLSGSRHLGDLLDCTKIKPFTLEMA